MAGINPETGTCLGIGGTNARLGVIDNGDLIHSAAIATPDNPSEVAAWMGRQLLDASDRGEGWLVAGHPGPVSQDGRLVGPLANVPSMRTRQFDLAAEMTAWDPAVGRLLDEGFIFMNVNDGELAAQAVARRIADKEDKVAALIIGTGVGAGIVQRDTEMTDIFRPDRSCPAEIGHLFTGYDPRQTYETTISGPALMRRYGVDPRELPANHSAWLKVGEKAGQLVMTLGLMQGVQLVVPTGGVGAGSSDKYKRHLDELLRNVERDGNGAQNLFLPNVVTIPPQEAQTFELHGAVSVMRDVLSRRETVAA